MLKPWPIRAYTGEMRFGRKKKTVTDEVLEMALHGYESSLEVINKKISDIKKVIGGGRRAIVAAVETFDTPRKRRNLSAKARRSISMAQKKRWAEAHKATAKSVKTVKAKTKKAVKVAKAAATGVMPL